MGLGATVSSGGLEVLAPRYRSDILHPVDLAEDVAIGYGYEHFGELLPRMATFGVGDPLTSFGVGVKNIMTGYGYFEVVTLSLSNPRDQFAALSLPEDRSAIRVKKPVSEEHSLVRTSVIPSLMTVLRKNKHRELPQKLFEIGTVVLNGKNRVLLAGVAIHARAGFTEVKSLVQSLLSSMGLDSDVAANEHPAFVRGRCANAMVGGESIGVFGELSPSTIEAFELRYPAVAFELDLERLYALKGPDRSS
jgi:phenylalanyl-tRNA synthetase beta chain